MRDIVHQIVAKKDDGEEPHIIEDALYKRVLELIAESGDQYSSYLAAEVLRTQAIKFDRNYS